MLSFSRSLLSLSKTLDRSSSSTLRSSSSRTSCRNVDCVRLFGSALFVVAHAVLMPEPCVEPVDPFTDLGSQILAFLHGLMQHRGQQHQRMYHRFRAQDDPSAGPQEQPLHSCSATTRRFPSNLNPGMQRPGHDPASLRPRPVSDQAVDLVDHVSRSDDRYRPSRP